MKPQRVRVGAWAGARGTDDHALARKHPTCGSDGVESHGDGIFETTRTFDDSRLDASQGDQQSSSGRVGSNSENRGVWSACGQ